jgi:hypothetical protein
LVEPVVVDVGASDVALVAGAVVGVGGVAGAAVVGAGDCEGAVEAVVGVGVAAVVGESSGPS